mmetsp:Transcript_32792/g.50058  ORF Transcript_32792/g.50058 Transcript_32792/m.50058 type:complete len:89 (+) Transcript_32792:960-1226(+)
MISKVRFGLDESFGVDYMDVRAESAKAFEMTFNGWGTFTVPMTIYWKRETGIKEPLELEHYLCFEGSGKWRSVNVPISKNKLNAIKSR